jgi:hypothetical protein
MRRLVNKLPYVAVVLTVLAGGLWWQRTPLLSWYYLRGLATAEEADRAAWVERATSLDGDAVPGLVDLLRRGNPKACANAEAALSALVKRWGAIDPRTVKLADDLASAFGSLHNPGKEAVLEWYLATLRSGDSAGAPPPGFMDTGSKLLLMAARAPETGMRIRTLLLAEIMLLRAAPAKADIYRDLALDGFAAKDNAVRVRAIRLAMHEPLHNDKALLERVLPFLKDPAPEVRCAALLAVGLAEEAISKEEMLPLLQDPNAEVRRLCEKALRGRGLTDSYIKLATLISNPRDGIRLQVVHFLHDAEDSVSGSGVWWQRLSEDASEPVRVAAIRFAAEDPAGVDFRERVLQMSRDDPSPTVRQLAVYYLKTFQKRD